MKYTIMLFSGLFILFLGLFINQLWLSMIGTILWVIGDSYVPFNSLSVKDIFLNTLHNK